MAEETVLTETVETPEVTEEKGAPLFEKEEEKADEGSAGKSEDNTVDEEASPGAPDKYEDFKLPDGFELDEARLGSFTALAKDAGLSQEHAQKFLDLHTDLIQQDREAEGKTWDDLVGSWKKASETDKEFGGREFKENIAVAKKVFDIPGLATSEFKEMLDATMVGSHPEMIRFMYRLGKMFSEDKIHVGGNPAGEAKSRAQILFGETSE